MIFSGQHRDFAVNFGNLDIRGLTVPATSPLVSSHFLGFLREAVITRV